VHTNKNGLLTDFFTSWCIYLYENLNGKKSYSFFLQLHFKNNKKKKHLTEKEADKTTNTKNLKFPN